MHLKAWLEDLFGAFPPRAARYFGNIKTQERDRESTIA
jgi:hypothetical protein